MLVEFKVKNFRSFKDEAVLSMVADTTGDHRDDLPENYIETGHPLVPRLLKVACIFGANASGKSNLMAAFSQFIHTIRQKGGSDSMRALLQGMSFATNQTEPSFFEISILLEGKLYCFSYSYSMGMIISEKLVEIMDDETESLIYSRQWDVGRNCFDIVVNKSAGIYNSFPQITEYNTLEDSAKFILEISAILKIRNLSEHL